eukprot:TRINITY_DN996_c0_g1_i1.p1 TRINITY_DN996_c0_g1~~TRINITY_DN996_c0_g1_i1.p1  ORF type:complete len:453 (+),score=164.78 TRINITY_DN996_c0_g1_i1:620-1978(+)
MDYTLAVYKSPEYENLSYSLALERLLDMGYPAEIASMKFDPDFPSRGLFLDKVLGNFLKIDRYGYILRCVHGRRVLNSNEIEQLYPPMQVHHDEIGKRFYLLNTLFNVVDACLFADLVDHFESKTQQQARQTPAEETDEPLLHGETFDISYSNLFQDVRSAVDFIHQQGMLKTRTMEDLERYIERDDRTAKLFDRLRKNGKKVFLMTNSGYKYTDKVMSYLVHGMLPEYENWKDYFDYIIVGAKKPLFFSEGTTLREVDLKTGSLKIGQIHELKEGHVYNGGSMRKLGEITGCTGPDVLYVGDHIFADIITSKKRHGWRNLLVVRELETEVNTWIAQQDTYNHLRNLEYIRAELYRGLDADSTEPPNIDALTSHMDSTIDKLSFAYNRYFGSLFQDGSKHSFFGMQVQRYADLYTSDCRNLLNYPMFYYFASWPSSLPHHLLGVDDIPSLPQ